MITFHVPKEDYETVRNELVSWLAESVEPMAWDVRPNILYMGETYKWKVGVRHYDEKGKLIEYRVSVYDNRNEIGSKFETWVALKFGFLNKNL